MFRKVCADYLIEQVSNSHLSSADKTKFVCCINLILMKLTESEEAIYNLDELERVLA